MADPFRRLLVLVTSAVFVVVAAAAALTRYADPYWLTDPQTTRSDSPALDTQMRLAKALQTMYRPREVPWKVVFVGSSTTYRGLNPAALDYPPGAVYNLGISSLRMQEAYAYIRHALHFSGPATVVIGLEFFQFDGLKQAEQDFEPGLGTWSTAIEMCLSSVTSGTAIANSLRVIPAKYRGGDGPDPWTRDGYRLTRPASEKLIEAQLANAVSIYQKANTRLPGPYDALRQMIALLRERGIVAKLYLSPVHPQYQVAIRSAGKESEYLEWRQRVRSIAADNGLSLLEIDKLHDFSGASFDGESGFNDPSHFAEWVGSMIMRELGLPVRAYGVATNGKRS